MSTKHKLSINLTLDPLISWKLDKKSEQIA